MISTIYTNASKTSGRVVLYSKSKTKDGKRKKLGEWSFTTKAGQKSSLTKAKNRERQIKFFKHQ